MDLIKITKYLFLLEGCTQIIIMNHSQNNIKDEDVNEINPHMPYYIVRAPWYVDTGIPSLKHQKFTTVPQKTIGNNQNISETKYQECDNCGALDHKIKECVERPRKLIARDITEQASRQVIDILKSKNQSKTEFDDFDTKRDRWKEFDPSEYRSIVERYETIEKQKKQTNDEHPRQTSDVNNFTLNSILQDDDYCAEDTDVLGQKIDTKQRMTVRNLRIREDIAKYLRNLDPNSAYYDPKTRSMRENPNIDKDPTRVDYSGDNFVRYTGEAKAVNQLSIFAWEMEERLASENIDKSEFTKKLINLQSNPSETERAWKEHTSKQKQLKSEMKQLISGKYNIKDLLDVPEILLQSTEKWIEYSRETGNEINNQLDTIPKSRFTEDCYSFNHTCVWGSWWNNGKWGYSCCHSTLRDSYCTECNK